LVSACTHLDQVRVDPPAEFAGCEDWSWCYVDELAFVLVGAEGS
jgi:hypothetical protein